MNQEDLNTVINNIHHLAKENGYGLTQNVEKIAKAKLTFFGIDNWHKCPCVRDDEHACISEKCRARIKEKGVCHCNLYKSE